MRHRAGDVGTLVGSVLFALGLIVVSVAAPVALPLPFALAVPLLLGGLLLPVWALWVLIAQIAVLGSVAEYLLWVQADSSPQLASAMVLVLVVATAHRHARRRARFGPGESRPDVILLELRERLRVQGELPALPAGWRAEALLQPAGGASFAGDFLVSSLLEDDAGRWLELAVADVSGKGVEAGTRALLLSGAMGGLLGAVPADRFLTEANRYLMRQRWDGGFASAVHLRLDLVSGEFWLESAGHPPAVHYEAGTGTWRMSRSSGPLLGVRREVCFEPDGGLLRPGDALMMYTDGVVEDARRDVDLGIDRLLGQADRLVPHGGFDGGARFLLDTVPVRGDDDRALVLLWRER